MKSFIQLIECVCLISLYRLVVELQYRIGVFGYGNVSKCGSVWQGMWMP